LHLACLLQNVDSMSTRYLLLVMVATLTVGCAARFDRLSLAETRGATAQHDNDVRIAVATEELSCECEHLVALRVKIENQSDAAAVIRYDHFALRVRGGERRPSLPLFDIADRDPIVPGYYRFPWSGFQLAPHLSAHYRGFWNGSRIQPEAEAYYSQHHTTLTTLVTPTRMMRRHALPEGTLEPGGYITGLLFFERPQNEQASLMARLGADESSQRVAQFEIPIAFNGR
jgi:hypothetical protein